MFLNKNFILANELVDKMGISGTNITILRKNFEHNDDFFNVQKISSCTFINTKARSLPKNYQKAIKENTFTDMTNKVPIVYVKKELGISEKELEESGICEGKMIVSGKYFYVFTREFIEQVKSKMLYVLTADEHEQSTTNGEIFGSIKLNKNKFLVWY